MLIRWLLQAGADPNGQGGPLRPFTMFLLSLKVECGMGDRVAHDRILDLFATLQAYISAGADMGDVVFSLSGRATTPTIVFVLPIIWSTRVSPLECNHAQLAQYARQAMEACLGSSDGGAIGRPSDHLPNLGHESHKSYEKVLLASRVKPGSLVKPGMNLRGRAQCVAINNSDTMSGRTLDVIAPGLLERRYVEMDSLLAEVVQTGIPITDPTC
ncbi:hypothetical protein N657DRAFT_42819 [Parathielavia appendiculata]|uniref:Uncharacterized protein n=1 Tax=Parathielavia appendiculata TaxID=2587402 RepID=A0AAN6UAB4_9PEZI|nr:hypothetical protein N657DRAFT_42819 [Parathielavia appendiculata]